MKTETLSILQRVQNGEITPQVAQEQLFVLFGVTNRTCSNCYHCVVNPRSEYKHDQWKCFGRENIVTITNIENHVCDIWASR